MESRTRRASPPPRDVRSLLRSVKPGVEGDFEPGAIFVSCRAATSMLLLSRKIRNSSTRRLRPLMLSCRIRRGPGFLSTPARRRRIRSTLAGRGYSGAKKARTMKLKLRRSGDRHLRAMLMPGSSTTSSWRSLEPIPAFGVPSGAFHPLGENQPGDHLCLS